MTEPALSIIALVPDRLQSLHRTLLALRAQDLRSRIELVFVTPVDALAVDASLVDGFWDHQVVRVPSWHSSSVARAAGIRHARAPIVVFVEDHCFPEPGWAAALFAAHREPWAGVGPVLRNANPQSVVSWANLLIEYGPWLEPLPRGEASHIPGHNSSYKRDLLLTYGDGLSDILEAESVLQWDLQRQGHRVAIEPDAQSRHENFARVGPSIGLRFHGGRLFAANRSASWPLARRLAFTAGSALIPFVRTARAAQHWRRLQRGRPGALVLPLTFLLLVVDALGECTGYAFRGGDAMRRLTELEFHRERFSSPRAHGAAS